MIVFVLPFESSSQLNDAQHMNVSFKKGLSHARLEFLAILLALILGLAGFLLWQPFWIGTVLAFSSATYLRSIQDHAIRVSEEHFSQPDNIS
jgi:hypothetical protein